MTPSYFSGNRIISALRHIEEEVGSSRLTGFQIVARHGLLEVGLYPKTRGCASTPRPILPVGLRNNSPER